MFRQLHSYSLVRVHSRFGEKTSVTVCLERACLCALSTGERSRPRLMFVRVHSRFGEKTSVTVCLERACLCALSTGVHTLFSSGHLLILSYTLSYTTSRSIYATLALDGRFGRSPCGAHLQWASHFIPPCFAGVSCGCAGACCCACSGLPSMHRTAPSCGRKRGTSGDGGGLRRSASNAQRG